MTQLNKCSYEIKRVMAIDKPIRKLSIYEKSDNIIKVITEITQVDNWIKKSRKGDLVLNRYLYYYCMTIIHGATYNLAAELLFRHENSTLRKPHDHSTVIHGKNVIADILELGNIDYRFKLVNQIIKQIK